MEQFVGMSKTGSIKEAAEGLKNPQFLILFDSSKERFKESVSQLEEMFPVCQVLGVWDSFTERHRCLKMVLWLLDFPVESVRQRMFLLMYPQCR